MGEFALLIQPDNEEPEAAEILVEGAVGGRQYLFLLDTGAARSCLVFDDFTAGFAATGTHQSSGVFAAQWEDLVHVPSIAFGPIVQREFPVARSAGAHPGQRNLIGMDLLKDHRCHFLFDEYRVVVDEEPRTGPALQTLFTDSKFHPYVDAQFGSARAAAVWDTGAGITVVDLRLVEQHPEFFQEVGRSFGTDATGASLETPTYQMKSVVIGGHAFPAHHVAAVDLSQVNRSTETPFQLILGYSTLRYAHWWFDFPGRVWGITRMVEV